MPEWVKDEDIWQEAKDAAKETLTGDEDYFYAYVTDIYKSMGGTIASLSKLSSVDNPEYGMAEWLSSASAGAIDERVIIASLDIVLSELYDLEEDGCDVSASIALIELLEKAIFGDTEESDGEERVYPSE